MLKNPSIRLQRTPRILIAPDKFKGSLSATAVSATIARAFFEVFPEAEIMQAPIADGGEGTAEIIAKTMGLEWHQIQVRGPLGDPVIAGYAWSPELSVIDMSAASGISLVAAERRDPLRSNTYGTGELIQDACRRGTRKIIVGLGGSATNDGGAGLAVALGAKLLDANGDVLEPIPLNFLQCAKIVTPEKLGVEITIASDVRNPLLGLNGASRIYGPQKGATPTVVEQLETALEHLANRVTGDLGIDCRNFPGAGAAGGTGFGLLSFCGASMQSGFDLIAEVLGLDAMIAQSDLVITGEGSLDLQSLEGKGPGAVALKAQEQNKPVFAFAGRCPDAEKLGELFDGIHTLSGGGISEAESIRQAENLLFLKAREVAVSLHSSVELTWADGELRVGNSLIQRRWKFLDGFPVPISLVAYGREWLIPDGKPGMIPLCRPLQAPLSIDWSCDFGSVDLKELPSHRGTLTVLDCNKVGYRWHLQIFEDSPSITSRIERVGDHDFEIVVDQDADVVSTGVENDDLSHQEVVDQDLMERLPLAPVHAQLAVVELADATDVHDNLASERIWRLTPKEVIKAATCLAAIIDPLTDSGLILLKHAPLPVVRPIKTEADVIADQRLVRLLGHGVGKEGQGYSWSVIAWKGGRHERTAALHQFQKQIHPYCSGRDGLLLSNTWGDRNRDAHLNEAFILDEIKAVSAMKGDVCQLDDGWQKGVSANTAQATKGVWNDFWATDPEFWTPHPERFPNGFEPIVKAAKENGVALGLWFAPDSSNDFSNWQKDADVIIGFYRQYGIRHIKVDGVKSNTRAGELNLHRFFSTVRIETNGEVSIDLDVTAEVRPGYFGAMQVGPIFLENRYTDWGCWWPHATLRNLWEISWYISPQRLRIEFLNPDRNQNQYAESPVNPVCYPLDYPFATTLVANPLAWFEVSNLAEPVLNAVAALATIWRKHRTELHSGIILPIGECPSGAAWTGFCSRHESVVHVLVFRELTPCSEWSVELPILTGDWTLEHLAGSGNASVQEGRLTVVLPESLHWIWVRLTQ